MHRGCIVHAPRWNFIKIGKKEGKREGGEELYERYRRRSAIKEWMGGGGRRLGHENRFFSRAAKKRRRGGGGSISSVLIHRGGKSGVPREIKVSDGTGTRRDEERRWNASLAFFPTVPPLPSSVAMSIEANLSTYAHTDARGARSADRDAIVCLVPRAVSTFPLPRVMHKVRERVPWQKIDASLRSFGDKRDALDPLFSPSFPSLPSYPQRDTVEKEEKRNKEKRKKRKRSVREIGRRMANSRESSSTQEEIR